MQIVKFGSRSKLKVFGKKSKLLNLKLSSAGSDHTVFLNGVLTNDIKALESNSFNYNLMLSEKGYPIDDFFVYKLEDSFLLDFEGSLTDKVERFNRLKLSLKVFFQEVSFYHYYLFGDGVEEFLDKEFKITSLIDKFNFISLEDGTIVARNPLRLGVDGYDIITQREIPLVNISEDEFESLRIRNCIPRIGKELKEGIIPLETNIWKHSISFTKGCYTGQEVIARIHYRGRPPRTMVKLKLSEYIPEGSNIFHGDKKVGIITSVDRNSLEGIGFILNSFMDVNRVYKTDEKELKLISECRELDV